MSKMICKKCKHHIDDHELVKERPGLQRLKCKLCRCKDFEMLKIKRAKNSYVQERKKERQKIIDRMREDFKKKG